MRDSRSELNVSFYVVFTIILVLALPHKLMHLVEEQYIHFLHVEVGSSACLQ